jgi:amino acid transporter
MSDHSPVSLDNLQPATPERSNHTVKSNSELADQLNKSSHGWDEVSSPPGATRKRYNSHDFPGYGSYNVHTKPSQMEMDIVKNSIYLREKNEVFLEELEATAISGNDILSSTFYVSGLVTLSAGKLTPVCLILVGVVLYLFRGIYHETVTALPINGGTYNILLNCTSKQIASMAAVLNIIAYITTGVVSGLDAIAYLQTVLPNPDAINQNMATIGLLAFFCLITNLGMQESASVAKVIFLAHLFTLSLLTITGCFHMAYNHELLVENWATPYPPVQSHHELNLHQDLIPGTMWTAIFYGFSSAMLGVSGFETSSQFVEEQAPGVFPKTLRNMWAGVMFFNPLLSLISFSALTVSDITEHKATVLAKTAYVVGDWIQDELNISSQYTLGEYFSKLVSIDAFIVLAAALLTSFVGINGLIRRMSMDRCLPQILLKQNPYTGTDSIILVGFFILCVSQILLLDGNVEALSGVYCYSFLGVMTIFAVGNILLKVKRPTLPREVSVGWIHSIVGLLSVVAALLGNVLSKPELLTYFFLYFFFVGTLVYIMFQRVRVGRLLFKLLKRKKKKNALSDDSSVDLVANEDDPLLAMESADNSLSKEVAEIYEHENSCLSSISLQLKSYQDVPFVFYCKHDDLHLLNKAILYIQNNEQTNKIIIVHCENNITNTNMLAEHVKLMDLLYPKIKISLLIIVVNRNV